MSDALLVLLVLTGTALAAFGFWMFGGFNE
jgi:hypothetical protein